MSVSKSAERPYVQRVPPVKWFRDDETRTKNVGQITDFVQEALLEVWWRIPEPVRVVMNHHAPDFVGLVNVDRKDPEAFEGGWYTDTEERRAKITGGRLFFLNVHGMGLLKQDRPVLERLLATCFARIFMYALRDNATRGVDVLAREDDVRLRSDMTNHPPFDEVCDALQGGDAKYLNDKAYDQMAEGLVSSWGLATEARGSRRYDPALWSEDRA